MFSYACFKNLLSALNDKLKKQELRIEIFAIGGFAMMCNAKSYGFDSRGLSIDIDSYERYSDDILSLVDEVSTDFGILTERWLNSHWYNKKDGFDEIIETYPNWRWSKSEDLTFSNITLYYASIEGLLKMKLSAINEKLELDFLGKELRFNNRSIGSSVRKNDLMDVKIMLDVLEEENLMAIKNAHIKTVLNHYPLAYEYLKEN